MFHRINEHRRVVRQRLRFIVFTTREELKVYPFADVITKATLSKCFKSAMTHYQKQMALKCVNCNSFPWNKAEDFKTPILCPNVNKNKIVAARVGKCTSYVTSK